MAKSFKTLVKYGCANYDSGFCLCKDCCCCQASTDRVVCRYFMDYVLPLETYHCMQE